MSMGEWIEMLALIAVACCVILPIGLAAVIGVLANPDVSHGAEHSPSAERTKLVAANKEDLEPWWIDR